MKPWGIALELLRSRRKPDFGINQFEVMGVMPRKQYRGIINNDHYGPSIELVDRLLVAMGCTWRDWGEVYEKAKSQASRGHPVKDGHQKHIKRGRHSGRSDRTDPASNDH